MFVSLFLLLFRLQALANASPGMHRVLSPRRWNRENPFPRPAAGDDDASSYLEQHALQMSYPASPNSAFLLTRAATLERQAFDAVAAKRPLRFHFPIWRTVGPDDVEFAVDPYTGLPGNISGRVTALVIEPSCTSSRCRLWTGTAGGGIWRTDRALDRPDVTWTNASAALGTNVIGSLTIDPNDPASNTIYAGTGESNATFTSGAGIGVYVSTDGAETWKKLPTSILEPDVSPSPIDFTLTRGISRIAVEPGNPNTIYVGTAYAMAGMTAVRGGQSVLTGGPQAKVGLYKTTDAGTTWTLKFEPPVGTTYVPGSDEPVGVLDDMEGVRDVQLDPRDPGTVYVAAFNNGIYRSSPRLEGGDASFKPVFLLTGGSGIQDVAALALTVKNGHTLVYAGNGVQSFASQAIYRLDNADVAASSLVTAGVGAPANSAAWIRLTSADPAQPGYTSYGYCGTQCSYDQVLAVPPGRPDTLFVGGQVAPAVFDNVIRSTDGGVSFSSFSHDTRQPPGLTHADVHAIAFDVGNPDVVFVGSDGGVARSSGSYGDASGLCATAYIGYEPGTPGSDVCLRMLAAVPTEFTFLNRGLTSLQFFNVAVDPNDPFRRIIGGTQDNGTLWRNSEETPPADRGSWSGLFPFGDGTSANGFHPANPDILFASFESQNFFTHFNGGAGGLLTWTSTGAPIAASGERYSGSALYSGRQFLTIDPVHPDTQFTGFEHIWRTVDNGGDPSFLKANCNLLLLYFLGVDGSQCGDWQPLGQSLTDATFGDRSGGVIVAASRTAADPGTLWAATNLGRVFVTHNADAANPADVAFTRVDSDFPAAPGRFVSGIAIDNANPNRAFLSYSGFSALTPGEKGHVFEVVHDPAKGVSTWTSLDADLGDLPINHLVRDDATGDLYAATDFGVISRASGATAWQIAGMEFPTALTPYLQIIPGRRLLFAATHGLGIWYLRLPEPGP